MTTATATSSHERTGPALAGVLDPESPEDPRDVPDPRVLERALSGDLRAWEALVAAHQGHLMNLARSYVGADVADIVQVAWQRLLESGHLIREPRALGGWLARVVQRECLRHRRQQRREGVQRRRAHVARGQGEGLPADQFSAVDARGQHRAHPGTVAQPVASGIAQARFRRRSAVRVLNLAAEPLRHLCSDLNQM
jgi:DNA-directed RNA polymerase specialized sigma24 family protein